MADNSDFTERLLIKQKSLFRIAASRGFTQDLIRCETDLPTTSLSDWANGKTKLSLVAVLKLAAMPDFPAELLTLLFEGTGRHVADDAADEPDFDAIGLEANGVAGEVQKARSKDSPGGTNIVPMERDAICSRVRRFKARAAAA